MGIDLTALSVLGGALGVGIGLGLQKLAANYVSGFAILLMVTVAAAAIFVPGQIATLVAAVASLAVLADATALVLTRDNELSTLLPAGLLGMLLFISSLLVQRLAADHSRVQRHSQRVDVGATVDGRGRFVLLWRHEQRWHGRAGRHWR